MRHEPISFELHAGERETASDVQMLVQASVLVAGIVIAMGMSGCSVADEADLHAAAPEANQNVAHAQPAPTASAGNVQDLTY